MTPLTALIYTDSDHADRCLRDIALALMERELALAGLVQHNTPRPGRSRCDMVLEELMRGELIPISQDRGPHARGCALDLAQLVAAMQSVGATLDAAPDLMILNKFGKSESEGGGFRPLIAEALARDIPVLVAVPWRNIESWRHFTGGESHEIVLDPSVSAATLAESLAPSAARPRPAARNAEI